MGPVIIIHGNPATYYYFIEYRGYTETLCNINQIGAGKRRQIQYCFLGAIRHFEGGRQINGIGKEGTVGPECWINIGTDRGDTIAIVW